MNNEQCFGCIRTLVHNVNRDGNELFGVMYDAMIRDEAYFNDVILPYVDGFNLGLVSVNVHSDLIESTLARLELVFGCTTNMELVFCRPKTHGQRRHLDLRVQDISQTSLKIVSICSAEPGRFPIRFETGCFEHLPDLKRLYDIILFDRHHKALVHNGLRLDVVRPSNCEVNVKAIKNLIRVMPQGGVLLLHNAHTSSKALELAFGHFNEVVLYCTRVNSRCSRAKVKNTQFVTTSLSMINQHDCSECTQWVWRHFGDVASVLEHIHIEYVDEVHLKRLQALVEADKCVKLKSLSVDYISLKSLAWLSDLIELMPALEHLRIANESCQREGFEMFCLTALEPLVGIDTLSQDVQQGIENDYVANKQPWWELLRQQHSEDK